ncbi:MAG: Ppx/GppA family phosphatase [Thermoleophilaceae bacterium]|nr:Ppx/GppA family phosphatase [Thermoleophilaceae bacterium]
MTRVAVVDMGSNSFRLVVYGYEPGESWAITDEIREAVRVGEGLEASGELSEPAMLRAVATAGVYADFCRASGIESIEAVATSAIRDASNQAELLGRLPLAPRILSAEEEARYAYIAIANSTTLEDGIGLDIGGGSVQLMEIADRRLERTGSWPLGAVRVSERFLADGESKKEVKALRKAVAEAVEGWQGERIAAVGGTVRNLAAAALKREGLGQLDVQGYQMTRDALGDLIDELASRDPGERGRVPGIKPDRGDVILGGALVLDAVLEAGGFDRVEVTEAGLREGIFFERFLNDSREPLLEDVRGDAVFNLSRRFHYEPRHTEHVTRLSLELLDGLNREGIVPVSTEARDITWAAGMLHDTGAAIDYDDHHKHSHYLILSTGLPGWTPRELVLIALAARYHRKGDPDASELGTLEEKGDAKLLALISGILRMAEQLERSRDGAVRSVEVSAENGTVRVGVEGVSDESVPVWSARRNSALLASALGREVEVVGDGG